MMDQMKRAQEIAKQAEVVNKELMEARVSGADPSGQVISTFNGLGFPIGMQVSEGILSLGSEAVSLACTQAMADGHAKSQNAMMQRMQQLYSSASGPK